MDTGGLLGPKYSFADQLLCPSEIGVHRSGTIDGVATAVGGINYYVDAIGFGEATLFAKGMKKLQQRPLGLRYFLKTGQTCHNGADMYEYISSVPSGLPGSAGETVKKMMGGTELRGLAPGIMEDSIGALNPLPMFKSVMGSGYAKCKKETRPVGDEYGRTSSPFDSNEVWVPEKTRIKYVKNGQIKGVSEGNKPHQTRWVFDSYISQEEYNNSPKTEAPGTFPVEGFLGSSDPGKSQLAAGLLLSMLFLGVVLCIPKK